MLRNVLAAAGAAALLAGAAYAQPAPDSGAPTNNAAPSDVAQPQAPPPAEGGSSGVSAPSAAGADTGAAATPSSGYNVGSPQINPTTGAQIVTNGPVPDTRQNRKLFGPPDSRAGRRTRAAGN